MYKCLKNLTKEEVCELLEMYSDYVAYYPYEHNYGNTPACFLDWYYND